MRCEALQNRTSSAGTCACAVASASQAALGPAVAQIGTASPLTAGSSPRGDDMPSQAAPRQKNERVLLPSDPGAKGPRGARPAARPPGAGGRGSGRGLEAGASLRGGGERRRCAPPRRAVNCKRLLLGAYTSSLIRTADSRAREPGELGVSGQDHAPVVEPWSGRASWREQRCACTGLVLTG